MAATDTDDALAAFEVGSSNFGAATVDLGAPGKEVLSAVPNGYGIGSGTSFAAPHVAAVAALIRATNPCLAPDDIVQTIISTVDPLPALAGKTVSEGRLNANTAMAAAVAGHSGSIGSQIGQDTYIGGVPLTVPFTASAACDPQGRFYAYDWDFRAGPLATGPDATHTYTEVGVHEAVLTVFSVAAPDEGHTVTIFAGSDFTDDGGSSFEKEIFWLSARAITLGCDPTQPFLFCPYAPVTRGQMASFLARALDLAPSATDFYSDDDTSGHEPSINAIAEAGITLGCSPGKYCPGQAVTRAQMASFLARALSLPPAAADYFSDDDGNSHERSINAIAEAGITLGCAAGLFCPTEQMPRDQMAAFLFRALGPA